MFHLVTGGSGSGKSAFAEAAACQYHKGARGSLLYIATMLPYGKETKQKICRHRKMRENKGFETVECYTDIEKLADRLSQGSLSGMEDSPCILLECISNLLANELYQPDGAGKGAVEAVIRGIRLLRMECRHLVIVTNEVCCEWALDSKEVNVYKKMMGNINSSLAEMADQVTEIVYGLPVVIKRSPGGEENGKYGGTVHGSEQIQYKDSSVGVSASVSQKKEVPGMKLVIGGAYQGKLAYAEKNFGYIRWMDGGKCSLEDIYTCEGIFHFEKLLRRMMEAGRNLTGLAARIAERNPNVAVISTEIGYGLVPIDAFDREYREQAGRVCTELAKHSSRVDRVLCGIGVTLKGER